MTASELLAQYGITVAQAREWIMSKLSTPSEIYNAAVSFGVTSEMLAEIVAPVVPGATADLVESFFTANGFDGSALGSGGSGGGASNEVFPAEFAALASLVTLNTNSGALSNASLRSAVLAKLQDDTDYDALFNPSGYEGAADGSFTADDLGIAGLSTLLATQENLESLYYGTLIRTFKAIDMNEILQIQDFATKNASALQTGTGDVYNQYVALMVSVFEDAAVPPIFTDEMLADSIALSTAMVAELAGGGSSVALFDGLFAGFIG